jgi:DNA polymerase-3 subunit chi
MTERVDFYILNEHTDNGRLLLACRLAEKAYNLQHKVYIHSAGEAQAQLLDDLLWTFRQNSFIPHSLYPAVPADRSPVLIGWHPDPAVEADVLLNLGENIPVFFESFARVIELVDQNEAVLSQSRQRFRLYRERGYEPALHRL